MSVKFQIKFVLEMGNLPPNSSPSSNTKKLLCIWSQRGSSLSSAWPSVNNVCAELIRSVITSQQFHFHLCIYWTSTTSLGWIQVSWGYLMYPLIKTQKALLMINIHRKEQNQDLFMELCHFWRMNRSKTSTRDIFLPQKSADKALNTYWTDLIS